MHPSGSLVPYDVTGRLDESLLFNGAGMVQFKPYFRGIAQPPNVRLTTAQKCVRTGDIESTGDDSHLTFFEMMGNFSFGDYFKEEAIAYSWEFLTSPEWLGLEPTKLCFTVFENDDVSFDSWSRHLEAAGLDPNARIFRLGEETNCWPAGAFTHGPPGPCGPNSEMFYWISPEPPPTGPYTREQYTQDDAEGKWLEIWNDVFIQYEWQGAPRNPERTSDGFVKTGMPNLPFNSVDTGMGLERTAAALGGKRTVYDTDAFEPILRKIEALRANSMPDQATSLREAGSTANTDPETRAKRIIADHIRTASFCIADGVLPSNTGRGYVLRRLIRRAVLKGTRVLGFEQPFFASVFEGVLESMGDHYDELIERAEVIAETLSQEEQQFRKTLQYGELLFMQVLQDIAGRLEAEKQDREAFKSGSKMNSPGNPPEIRQPADLRAYLEDGSIPPLFPGRQAFVLYDTFGFPLEVTQELCKEAGIEVDLQGYEQALAEAQDRSRGASGMDTVYRAAEDLVLAVAEDAPTASVFLGYDRTQHMSRLVQMSPRFDERGVTDGRFQVSLDETPFYPQSGGQLGDTGAISSDRFTLRVTNTWKELGLIWHDVVVESIHKEAALALFGPQGDFGRDPRFEVATLRGISKGTILEVLQSGFFFTEVAAKVDAQRRVEITRNHTATHLLHAALRKVLGKHVTQAGSQVAPEALRFDFTHGQALTNHQLSEVERLVNAESLANIPVVTYEDVPVAEAKRRGAMALFGEKYGDTVRMVQVADFSLELCGGCHVRGTGEIGMFKILREGSAASGVRRIEAVTGEHAYKWALSQHHIVEEAAETLKTTPQQLSSTLEKHLEHARELQKRLERARSNGASASNVQSHSLNGLELTIQRLTEADLRAATLAADRLVENLPRRVAVVTLVQDGKITFVCKAGPEAVALGANAGNLVREMAKLAGGGGGGRADFATAGGRLPDKLEDALKLAEEMLAGAVAAR